MEIVNSHKSESCTSLNSYPPSMVEEPEAQGSKVNFKETQLSGSRAETL